MSVLDFVEGTEVSAESPGLGSPGIQIEKRVVGRFEEEFIWSKTAPDCGDNPVNSV